MRVVRTLGVGLLGLAALGYCGWVLEFFLPTGVPPWQSYVAELSADGRPYQDLFRVINFVTGALALASTPFLARLVPAQLMPRLTVIAVAVFGIVMLLRGGLTLDCAPSVGEICRQRQAGGTVSSAHTATWVLSVATSVLFLLGVASAERWFPRGMWRNGLRVAFLLAAALGTTIIVLDAFGPGHLVGVAVRAQLVVQAATLFTGATYLAYAARWPADSP